MVSSLGSKEEVGHYDDDGRSSSMVVDDVNTSAAYSNMDMQQNATLADNHKNLSALRKPNWGERTFIVISRPLRGGLTNQIFMFQGIVMTARERNCTQILLPSIQWRDHWGTRNLVQHDSIFDVDHWNSFYPLVPRLVEHDPMVFPGYNVTSERFDKASQMKKRNRTGHANSGIELFYGRYQKFFSKYYHYTMVQRPRRELEDVIIYNGALRPHPDIRHLVDQYILQTGLGTFLTLHARVEPDMQYHDYCRGDKVRELKQILRMLYAKFPSPPSLLLSSKVLIAINRQSLEAVESNNTIGMENVKLFHSILENGLWNGSVPVMEAGTAALDETRFQQDCPSLCGALFNMELAIQSSIFVGAPVSSWSVAVVLNRHYRNLTENYYYVPGKTLRPVAEHFPRGRAFITNTSEPQPFTC